MTMVLNNLFILNKWLGILEAEEVSEFSFFNLRALSMAEVLFYIGVTVITALAVGYLVWSTIRSNKNQFKDTDIPVETIKLKVKSKEERQKEKKYEKEVEDILKKKRRRRYKR